MQAVTDTKCETCGGKQWIWPANNTDEIPCPDCAPAAKEPTTVLCIDDVPYNMRAAKEPGVRRYAFRYTGGSWDRIAPLDWTMPDEYYDGITTAELVLATDYDSLEARVKAVEGERDALRNLANNLQPGPISEALAGTRYTREADLQAHLTTAKEDLRQAREVIAHLHHDSMINPGGMISYEALSKARNFLAPKKAP